MVLGKKKGKKEKAAWREWLEAILFALGVFLLARFILIDLRAVPTTSMEHNVIAGDFIAVSKLHYGSRIPITPLSIPLVGPRLPFSPESPSYTTALELPYWRLPGFSEIKRQDVVVFNYPGDRFLPIDHRTHFIKRCVGLPGDTVRITYKLLYVNGEAEERSENLMFDYLLRTTGDLDFQELNELGIYDGGKYGVHNMWKLAMTDAAADTLYRHHPLVENLEPLGDRPGNHQDFIYPYHESFPWNKDHFGPFYLPKEGDSLLLTPENLLLYESLITAHERQVIEYDDSTYFINGTASTHYVFQQNYFFMLGDNRDHSSDSRFWGPVPESHLIGKAVTVLFSADKRKPLHKQFRWDRFFKSID